MQALSLEHPGDGIVYHFIDDKKEYGKALYDLFTAHPELIPSNVSFTFDWCDYYVWHELSTKPTHHGQPIKGTGETYRHYKELAKEFALRSTEGKPLGKTISGVIYAFKPELRALLTPTPKRTSRKKKREWKLIHSNTDRPYLQRSARQAPRRKKATALDLRFFFPSSSQEEVGPYSPKGKSPSL